MTAKQQVEHRALLTKLMQIAHGLGTTTSDGDLIEHVRQMEVWFDKQIDIEITRAVRPFINFEATNLPKRRDLK